MPGKSTTMPSYLSIHRATTMEQLPSLLKRAEALLSRPAADVTVRNVAVVPRTRQVYVHANASAPALVSRLLAECGLAPVSIAEAGRVEWGRLIGARLTTEDPLEPDDVMPHGALAAKVGAR
jgi:hypothetical protein